MKEIKAYIKPHKLSVVALALEGLSDMSAVDLRVFGRGKAKNIFILFYEILAKELSNRGFQKFDGLNPPNSIIRYYMPLRP